MKITDEAKKVVEKALADDKSDCLKVTEIPSCCGTSLKFSLARLEAGEEAVNINGIPVLMDEQTKKRAETVTLAANEGGLVIQDTYFCSPY